MRKEESLKVRPRQRGSACRRRSRLWLPSGTGITWREIRILTLLLAFNCSLLHAQNNELRFEPLTIAQGLPANHVTCIFQDRQGFLWFGTVNGLVRYDGYNMKVFKHDPDDPRSLSHNGVSRIYEDRAVPQGALAST
jgi:hypothetical protein